MCLSRRARRRCLTYAAPDRPPQTKGVPTWLTPPHSSSAPSSLSTAAPSKGGAIELPPNARILLDLIVEGTAPGDLLAEIQAARDEVVAISGADTADDLITALDAIPSSTFRVQQDARLSATIAATVPPVNMLDDSFASWQDAADAARAQGRGLYVPPGTHRLTADLNVYSDLICDGAFVISAGLNVGLHVERTATPVTLTATALGGLVRDSSQVTGLAGLTGTLHLQSTEVLLLRNNPGAPYYKEEVVEVVLADGTCTPPIALTYTDLSTVTATLYPAEQPITLTRPDIRVDGSTVVNDTGFFRVHRSNVQVDGLKLRNTTGLSLTQGAVVQTVTRVTFNDPIIDKFDLAGAGYGLATYNTANLRIVNPLITKCRHAISGRFNKTRSVDGGTIEGGFDDHWGWDTTMDRVQSVIGAGNTHIGVCGRTIRVRNCTFIGGRNIIGVRADTPEMGGVVEITGGEWTPSPGSAAYWMIGYSSLTLAFFDHGRTIESPIRCVVRDVDVNPAGVLFYAVRVSDVDLPHKHWANVEITDVRSSNPTYGPGAYYATKQASRHPDDAIGPVVTIRGVNFGGAFDHVYVHEITETADAQGLTLRVVDCRNATLKFPDGAGVKELTVRNSEVAGVKVAAVGVNAFAGEFLFESCLFVSPAFTGKWLASFRDNIWSGAATSSNATTTARVLAWFGNLKRTGSTGVATNAEGYINPAKYI